MNYVISKPNGNKLIVKFQDSKDENKYFVVILNNKQYLVYCQYVDYNTEKVIYSLSPGDYVEVSRSGEDQYEYEWYITMRWICCQLVLKLIQIDPRLFKNKESMWEELEDVFTYLAINYD